MKTVACKAAGSPPDRPAPDTATLDLQADKGKAFREKGQVFPPESNPRPLRILPAPPAAACNITHRMTLSDSRSICRDHGARASADGARGRGDGARGRGDGARGRGDGARGRGDGAKASAGGTPRRQSGHRGKRFLTKNAYIEIYCLSLFPKFQPTRTRGKLPHRPPAFCL